MSLFDRISPVGNVVNVLYRTRGSFPLRGIDFLYPAVDRVEKKHVPVGESVGILDL